MFIVDLNYLAPLDQIDAAMGDHMRWLRACYKKNIFIASGRKVPRTGGIILALADSKGELEKIMNQDPFCTNKLAEFTIIEFQTSQSHPDLKLLLDQLKAPHS
jgi:uncharacterized protein YciI